MKVKERGCTWIGRMEASKRVYVDGGLGWMNFEVVKPGVETMGWWFRGCCAGGERVMTK